ncbi:MAG TPA: tryptophan synthase subunit beta, partial [Vicinamibacteria bacterium]
MSTSRPPVKKELDYPRIGAFGPYGGRYVPELLIPALTELERAQKEIVPREDFRAALSDALAKWAGRPTPLTRLDRFARLARLDVVLKREDLLHGGAH